MIVCVASSWDYDPTSKHQIMRILSERNDVVWVNYHGSRRPDVSRADLRSAWSAVRRISKGIRRVTPSMIQVTPLVIPGAARPLMQKLNQRMLVAQIRRAIRSIDPDRKKPLQVWSFAPDVPYLQGAFNEECFIYYCVDDYTQFEGFDAERIRSAENETIERADVVVTTSDQLLATRSVKRPDAVLVRHGVDFDHFARAWRQTLDLPMDIAEIPRPIFGYFGLIHHWVDQDLLSKVARARPYYSFVIIGDCQVDVSALRRTPNVVLLGRRDYQHLPAYCAAFDAGLLLFDRTEMTQSVNPIKMYEYLAAGLPVISTSIPEALRYVGPIRLADTPDEFAGACDDVLADFSDRRRETISRTVQSETWRSRVDTLSEIVMGHVNGSPRTLPRSGVERPSSTGPVALPATAIG